MQITNLQKWQSLSAAAQLGNLGSEFSRACKWKGKNQEYFFAEVQRFTNYISAMMLDAKWQNHRSKELCRLKESALACLSAKSVDEREARSIQNYFDQFALLRRE